MAQPARPYHEMSALLTGATSGMGLETAAQMAEAGVKRIMINGRDTKRGARAVDIVKERGGADTDIVFVDGDASTLQVAKTLAQTVEDRFGGLDILMNAVPGVAAPKPFEALDSATFSDLIQRHLLSNFYCTHAALPLLIKRGGGTALIVSSDAAKIPTPGESVHGALMAALDMFARTLALENARHYIRVHTLTPSIVGDTISYERMMADPFSKKLFERALSRASLGVPKPADIAAVAVFLAGPDASRMTGQSITINGGIAVA